jgi:hypothetical protein
MNNLEHDLMNCDWLRNKVRTSDGYAQNLYAAMCNQTWQKLDVIDILTDTEWSCTWRYAGGIIADLREQGDYIDWYCSGIGSQGNGNGDADGTKGYVSEGCVTDEIEQDLKTLGWIPGPEDESI